MRLAPSLLLLSIFAAGCNALVSGGGADTFGDGGVVPLVDLGADQSAGVPDAHGPGCGLRTCASAGANCGPVGDGCGGLLDCGACPMGQSCGGGGGSRHRLGLQ